MADAFSGAARQHLNRMAQVEWSFERGQRGKSRVRVLSYLDSAHQLLRMLDATQVEDLKLLPRMLKKVLVPAHEAHLLDDEVGQLAFEFYRQAGDVKYQRKLCMLIARVKDLSEQLDAKMRNFYHQLLDQHGEDVDVWGEFLSLLAAAQRYSEWLMYAVIAMKDKPAPMAPSVRSLDSPDTFEGVLYQAIIIHDQIDISILKALFLKRLKSLPPNHTAPFLSQIAVALVRSPARHVLAELSEVLQTWSPEPAAQYTVWACGLMEVFLLQGSTSTNLYSLSLWLWICSILNKIPKSPHPRSSPSSVSPSQLFRDTRPRLLVGSLSSLDWAGYCERSCADESLARHLVVRDGVFALGPALLRSNGSQPSIESHSRPSTKQSISKDISQGAGQDALENVLAEIALLKMQRAHLLSSTSVIANRPSLDSSVLFVLDTNILLDYCCSLGQILLYHELTFAVPSLVLAELEGLSQGARRGDRAHAVLDFLHVPNHRWRGHIVGLTVHGRATDLAVGEGRGERWPVTADIRSNDDAILWTVQKTKQAVLLTDDVNLALKATANKVLALSWPVFVESLSAAIQGEPGCLLPVYNLV